MNTPRPGYDATPDDIGDLPAPVRDDLSWAAHRLRAVAAGVENADGDDSAKTGCKAIIKDVAERLDELRGD